jgi:hypothetical protein
MTALKDPTMIFCEVEEAPLVRAYIEYLRARVKRADMLTKAAGSWHRSKVHAAEIELARLEVAYMNRETK